MINYTDEHMWTDINHHWAGKPDIWWYILARNLLWLHNTFIIHKVLFKRCAWSLSVLKSHDFNFSYSDFKNEFRLVYICIVCDMQREFIKIIITCTSFSYFVYYYNFFFSWKGIFILPFLTLHLKLTISILIRSKQ